jgi:hypothetical protein
MERKSSSPIFQLGVPEETARRWQADFLHQFILAGASSR